ncbi:MAG TPA: CopG family transcriptional regulator [Thermoanaerobaculia bacterium]|nr:CopG family transcriptional regulator [Thermoanaerobaculia bacterium]
MHRTQLNLDDWQYEALLAKGEREGRSLSDLVREAVAEYLVEPPVPRRSLSQLKGMAEDPEGRGRDHDRLLYPGP